MKIPFHSVRAGVAVTVASLAFYAAAQTFPNRPITVVYPFGSGTSSDVFSRAIATEAGRILGQPIIYENRPGAQSRLGIAAIQSAKPDGYLLAIAQDLHLVAHPLLSPEYKLDVDKDYVPIAALFDQPLVFIAHPSVPFRDMKGLVAYAKANPGKLNFSITSGSISVFTAAMLQYATDISFTLVPYKQASQQLIDLLEGRTDLMVSATTVKPHIDSGKVVALAATGATRWSALPNLPTITEQGVPVATSVWWSVIAPGNTPREAVQRLSSAFNEARKQPGIQKVQADYAFVSLPYLTPGEMAEKIRAQSRTMEPAIRKAGIKLE